MIFPELAGLRTQLALKAQTNSKELLFPGWLTESYTERLALPTEEYKRYAAGYYNDTQHRYHTDLSILKEKTYTDKVKRMDICDWSNLYALEKSSGNGVVLLKESHKCVNQTGLDTGHFKVNGKYICSTGTGLKSHYADGREYCSFEGYRTAWAHWCLLYQDGETGRQTVVKKFDRARFPFRFDRDALITSNTWGSRGSGEHSRSAANETDVLKEIDLASRLGIDCVQIDDGWQCYENDSPLNPSRGWYPSKERFSNGSWDTVVEKAREKNVKLGIWFPWYAPLEQMVANIQKADFKQIKIDFLDASTRKILDEAYMKAKELTNLGEDIQVNADLTETTPRFGYYFARDCCALFPQNIEMCFPDEGIINAMHITYTPHISLRQAWNLSKYLNLNKIQLSIQNIDIIPKILSDASMHTHSYCFAIAMMGLPLFFLETKFYSEEALRQLEDVLEVYRAQREEILSGIVYPIGDEPDNQSITGFQSHQEEKSSGYISVFRELHAPEAISIPALFLAGKTVCLYDVYANEEQKIMVDASGRIPVRLPDQACWQLLKYSY